MRINQWIFTLLKGIPPVLKALWLFFPGIFFLLLATFAFCNLSQGKDVIRQCLEQPRWVGAIAVLAIVFWVFVTWYTARLVSYNHTALFAGTIRTPAGTECRIGNILFYHGPRLIAFAIFTVLLIAFLQFNRVDPLPTWMRWSIIAIELALYVLLHRILRPYGLGAPLAGHSRLLRWRTAVRIAVLAACVVLILFWGRQTVLVLMTVVLQFGFLFLVIVRRPVAEQEPPHTKPARRIILDRYLDWVFEQDKRQQHESLRELKGAERSMFRFLNGMAVACFVCYILAVFWLPFARAIGPMAFIFLAFGILLGIGNFMTLLSKRTGTNLHFVAVAIVFLFGLFTEPHWARVTRAAGADLQARRPDFKTYLQQWLLDSSRRAQIQQDTAGYPVFFVLADGGASRSGYWTALVLSRLTDETKGGQIPFYQHLFCLSGASGGSVGHGTYVAALAHKDSLLHSPMGFRKTTTAFLGSDFLTFTLARLLGPDLIAPITYKLFNGDRAAALETSLEKPQNGLLLAGDMQAPFSRFYPLAPDSQLRYPIVVFNTTRMQDGNPGVVANINLDTPAFGNRIDVLDSIAPEKNLRLSTAMVLSARFPYISPAGRIGNSYFVDGGYFDNSGAGIVHEMLLEIARIRRDSALPAIQPLLHKLRFYVIHITNAPYRSGTMERVHPFKNDLAAPLLTLAGSYTSQTDVNNTRLKNYLHEISGDQTRYIQFNLYKWGIKESFPMNWVISEALRQKMDQRVDSINALDSVILRLNLGKNDLFRGLDVQSAPGSDSVASAQQP